MYTRETKFGIDMHRKPTFTDTIIPFTSCHPYGHKFVAVRYLMNSVTTYQFNLSAIKEEWICRQNVFHNSSFPLSIIYNFQEKIRKEKAPHNDTVQKHKWVTFTFFGKETKFMNKL